MREFNLFQPWKGKPQPERRVGRNLRTIRERIIASYRDGRYYDGSRNCGYGGYVYDGRWRVIADFLMESYGLPDDAAILQLGCEKGFLLHDLHERYPETHLTGHEVSRYAIEHAMPDIRPCINQGGYVSLPYGGASYDFVLAIGVVYTLSLADAICCLREIERVGKGKSFVTLGAYETEEDRRLFEMWTLLGTTILHKEEWIQVLEHVGYRGDYAFTTAQSLHLVACQDMEDRA